MGPQGGKEVTEAVVIAALSALFVEAIKLGVEILKEKRKKEEAK